MYAYCLNNPVMMVDDSGMCPKGVMGPCPGLFNCPYNTLQSKKYVPAPTKNADPFTSTGHNCYRDGCMGTVVVAEEGTGNGERLNATITVINSNGDTTFAGSTLPDNPAETYNNLNVATLNIGEYKITQIPGGYLNKPAYYVLDINSNSDSVSATRLYGTPSAYWDTATGIYIHKGSNNSPGVGKRWSVGCILIDNAQIDAFASKVGSEGILIVRR